YKFYIVLIIIIIIKIIMYLTTSRYFIGSSFTWGSELAQYLHICQIWIGASLAVRLQSHIRVDVFVKLFPPIIQKVLNFMAILFCFVFAAFLAYEVSAYVLDVFDSVYTSISLHLYMSLSSFAYTVGRYYEIIIDIL